MLCYSKKKTPTCQWPNIANSYFLFTHADEYKLRIIAGILILTEILQSPNKKNTVLNFAKCKPSTYILNFCLDSGLSCCFSLALEVNIFDQFAVFCVVVVHLLKSNSMKLVRLFCPAVNSNLVFMDLRVYCRLMGKSSNVSESSFQSPPLLRCQYMPL